MIVDINANQVSKNFFYVDAKHCVTFHGNQKKLLTQGVLGR